MLDSLAAQRSANHRIVDQGNYIQWSDPLGADNEADRAGLGSLGICQWIVWVRGPFPKVMRPCPTTLWWRLGALPGFPVPLRPSGFRPYYPI